MTARYVCDCGRAYSDLAGLEACQIGNHGQGCPGCRAKDKAIARLNRDVTELQRRLDETREELSDLRMGRR